LRGGADGSVANGRPTASVRQGAALIKFRQDVKVLSETPG